MDLEVERESEGKVSYLQARDVTILSWNRTNMQKVKVNLKDKYSTDTHVQEKEDDGHLNVFLRIKGGVPFENSLYEICGDVLNCKIPLDSYAARNMRDGEMVTKKYSFSKIFGADSKQIELFNSIVKPQIFSFINGQNSTLLTYGTSSAGKTFTIVGTPSEPGIIPRALEYLFKTLPKLREVSKIKPTPHGKVKCLDHGAQKEEFFKRDMVINSLMNRHEREEHMRTYKAMQLRLSSEPVAEINTNEIEDVSLGVWVSFAEIYNEYIYDLLQPPPPKGKNRPKLKLGSSDNETYIKDLTYINVSSGKDAFIILQYGLQNLNYAATALNSHSSRSHCIFTIRLVQAHKSRSETCVSQFNFCDLAGSERLNKTHNVGDRLVESNNINTSLLVLGRCINNIRTNQQCRVSKVPPFRESKLTQLFQKSLMGLEHISMIVNISPSRELFDETQHVLNFSAVAKDIICEEQPRTKNRFSEYMERKMSMQQHNVLMESNDEEIERLQCIIDQLRDEIEAIKYEAAKDLEAERKHYVEGFNKMISGIEETHKYALSRMENQFKEEIKALKSQNERLKQQIENLQEDLDDSDVIILDSDDEKEQIKLLEQSLEEKNQIILDLRKMLVDKDTLIFSLKSSLCEKDNLLCDAESSHEELMLKIKELKSEVFLLNEKNAEQEALLEMYARREISDEDDVNVNSVPNGYKEENGNINEQETEHRFFDI